jgi:hypothetical protein
VTTLGQLIDRTLRDWLEPADDQPTRASLASSIDADDTSLTYDPAMLGPEEEELLAPGTLIQIGSEEILVGDIDEDEDVLSDLTRAVNGTSAAAHTAGDLIYPSPVWRRRSVFDALCDGLVKLYPDLYRVPVSASISVGTSYTEVPQAVVDDGIVAGKFFIGRTNASADYDEYPVALRATAPYVTSGKAFTVDNLISGASGYLVYKAKFLRPTDEDDDLTADFGLLEDWEQIVILDAVAYLIAAREMDLATQERLSQQLEQQGYPAGTPTQIRDGILRYKQLLMQRAKDALRVENQVTVTMIDSL